MKNSNTPMGFIATPSLTKVQKSANSREEKLAVLTPEERLICKKSTKQFDALYRKLAE
ncbi:MAG: hypothetical protein HAW67_01890 [Endozoicomonadaceae bacterium]|nr:hypothetical protein [Endozoicomonadaceae bacterium]